jgi:hypothetical protein
MNDFSIGENVFLNEPVMVSDLALIKRGNRGRVSYVYTDGDCEVELETTGGPVCATLKPSQISKTPVVFKQSRANLIGGCRTSISPEDLLRTDEFQRIQTSKMVSVMVEWTKGKKVQCRLREAAPDDWRDVSVPSWKWDSHEYRVKPDEPEEIVKKTEEV